MKFSVKNKTGENIINSMRSVGYHFLARDVEKEQLSFIHPIGGNAYPRFHLYVNCNKETNNKSSSLYSCDRNNKEMQIFCHLHLDQKKPIYPVRKTPSRWEEKVEDNTRERLFKKKLKLHFSNGVYKGASHAHNADYEGEVIEKEVQRVKQFFEKL